MTLVSVLWLSQTGCLDSPAGGINSESPANWVLKAEAKDSKPEIDKSENPKPVNLKSENLKSENQKSVNLSMESLASLYSQGRYLDSAKIAQKLVDKNPKNLTARYYLGNSYLKLGLPHEALNQYSFCVNFGKGTQIAAYAQEAIGGINTVLTGAAPQDFPQAVTQDRLDGKKANSASAGGSTQNSSNAMTNKFGSTTSNTTNSTTYRTTHSTANSSTDYTTGKTSQDRNYALKTDILTRGSQKIEDLKAKFKEDLKRLQKEFEGRTAGIPPEKRPTPGGMKARDQLTLAEDPQTRRYLEALDLQEKTSLNLSSKLAEDIDRITSECKRQVEAIDSGDPRRQKMSAGSANVRDYVNYGDSVFDTIPDEAPLTARAKALIQNQNQSKTQNQIKNQNQNQIKNKAKAK